MAALFNASYQDLVANATSAAIYCALDDSAVAQCSGLCTNTDVSGIGVRVAFYVQSLLIVVLVAFSPDDSAAGQWSAVMLSAALIIPAIIQKYSGNLTLFHATLVLNFATLSTLVSLAIAPRCTVWRAEDRKNDKIKFERRGRVILSVALIVQVILQWLWAVIMFTAPEYSQSYCNGQTTLVFFGWPLLAQDIDPYLRPNSSEYEATGEPPDFGPGHFSIWPTWLLFCLGLTLAYGIVLVISSSSEILPSPSGSHRTTAFTTRRQNSPLSSRRPSRARTRSPRGAVSPWGGVRRRRSVSPPPAQVDPAEPPSLDLRALLARRIRRLRDLMSFWPKDPARRWLFCNYALAVIFALFFIGITESQHALNTLLPGENDVQNFSQSAALLFAITPLFSLGIAFYQGRLQKQREETEDECEMMEQWKLERGRAERRELEAAGAEGQPLMQILVSPPAPAPAPAPDPVPSRPSHYRVGMPRGPRTPTVTSRGANHGRQVAPVLPPMPETDSLYETIDRGYLSHDEEDVWENDPLNDEFSSPTYPSYEHAGPSRRPRLEGCVFI